MKQTKPCTTTKSNKAKNWISPLSLRLNNKLCNCIIWKHLLKGAHCRNSTKPTHLSPPILTVTPSDTIVLYHADGYILKTVCKCLPSKALYWSSPVSKGNSTKLKPIIVSKCLYGFVAGFFCVFFGGGSPRSLSVSNTPLMLSTEGMFFKVWSECSTTQLQVDI